MFLDYFGVDYFDFYPKIVNKLNLCRTPLINYLFPSTCIFCGATSSHKLDLCVACENDLPFLQPLPKGQAICGAFRTFALFYYQTPVKQLMLGLKFNNRLVNAKIFGELLASHLYYQYQNQEKPEVIIPMPLHFTRLRERGYNQALELARPIAKKLKIPIDKSSAERTKNTIAQALLPAKKRAQNTEQAFCVNKAKIKRYKHVAVVDDVITTGNTATEFCKMLYQNGVNKIDVWCVAKAHYHLLPPPLLSLLPPRPPPE